MTALDTDVYSDVLDRVPAYVQRLGQIPPTDRAVPVVVWEEVLRGRLSAIRQAQAGRTRVTLARAYDKLRGSLEDGRSFRILPYTLAADALFLSWRNTIRIGTRDLRIAAICVFLSVTLATRNARDFRQVPGLTLDIWP